MNKNTLYLLNPLANEKSAKKRYEILQKKYAFLPKDPIDVTKIDDLKAYIEKENPEKIVIAGGDGTINKVCQAVIQLKEKPTMALLPIGFGNALSFCLGVETVEKAISVIKNPQESLTIDLFKTTIPEVPLGVFTMGVGFDGQIVHTRMYHAYIGIRSYILSIIRSYFTHVDRQLTLTIDHETTITSVASALIMANAPIIGRNFLLSDTAKLNDGFLDCTLFSSHYAYITNFRMRGFKHPLYSEKNKVYFKAKHISISGDQFAQVDGDPAIHVKPIEIEVMPKAVTFYRNALSQIVLPSIPFE